MALIARPEACKAVIALSRPEPGPFTFTSTSLTPYLVAVAAAVSAARCAANGVLLRLPLKPTVPEEAQHKASPFGSVIVTVVLLNVALMCTTARLTLRLVFLFFAFATCQELPRSNSCGCLVSGLLLRLKLDSTRAALRRYRVQADADSTPRSRAFCRSHGGNGLPDPCHGRLLTSACPCRPTFL